MKFHIGDRVEYSKHALSFRWALKKKNTKATVIRYARKKNDLIVLKVDGLKGPQYWDEVYWSKLK